MLLLLHRLFLFALALSLSAYVLTQFFLRPHYQLEGLTMSLRLVSNLPSLKESAS